MCIEISKLLNLFQKKALDINIEEEEIKQRLKKLKVPEPKVKTGYLKYYTNFVGSADKGAVRNI